MFGHESEYPLISPRSPRFVFHLWIKNRLQNPSDRNFPWKRPKFRPNQKPQLREAGFGRSCRPISCPSAATSIAYPAAFGWYSPVSSAKFWEVQKTKGHPGKIYMVIILSVKQNTYITGDWNVSSVVDLCPLGKKANINCYSKKQTRIKLHTDFQHPVQRQASGQNKNVSCIVSPNIKYCWWFRNPAKYLRRMKPYW